MSNQSGPFIQKEQLRVAMLIHGALIAGATMFGVILVFTCGLPPMPDLSKLDIGYVGIIATVVAIALSVTALAQPFKLGLGPTTPREPVARAFAEWQATGLVRAAVLEGSALVNFILAVFAGGGLANLVPALFSMAMLGFFFPTRDGWERYRDSRVQELEI